MRAHIMSLLVVTMLSGCVTPYGPRGYSGGYSEVQMKPGEWWLEVNGNGFTARTTLISYFHRRAQELCGGPYESRFETESEQSSTGYSVSTNSGTNWSQTSVRPRPPVTKYAVVGTVTCGGAAAAAVPPPPPGEPAGAGCSYDTQCKGNRICVAGSCREP